MREESESNMLSAPPRLLLGVAFLFWGGMHDHAVAGLIAAVLIEGRYWVNLRWDFTTKAFARSWQLSVFILILSALALLEKDDLEAIDFLNLLSWLPFMMLPLVLAQQYVREGGVPMVTFSFIARRKAAIDRKAGRQVETNSIHLGYPFLFLVMIAAGMGAGSLRGAETIDFRYPIGVVILLGWAIFTLDGWPIRQQAWIIAYLISILMTLGMLGGVLKVYDHFVKGYTSSGGRVTSTQQTQTSLGRIRELQLSHKIEWRYFHGKGPTPKLLKLGSYNEPLGDIWQARTRILELAEQIPDGRKFTGDFEVLLSDGGDSFLFVDGERERGYNLEGRLRGLIEDEGLIPHFGRTNRFEGVPSEVVAVNSMGSVKMVGVNQGAMDAKIQAGSGMKEMRLDPTDLDLTYPKAEEEGLEEFLKAIGLSLPEVGRHPTRVLARKVGRETGPPDLSIEKFRDIKAKIGRTFFDVDKFEYSLFLAGADRNAPITEFLKIDRKGHCEYFAGATAMLMRRMGVPCRYAVGYSLHERGFGEQEWILRGQHAHAWVEAYVGGTWVNERNGDVDVWRCRGGEWVDVDLTPPDWVNFQRSHSWYQVGYDWFQGFRTSLELWVNQSGVFDWILTGVILLGLLLLIFVIYRLGLTRKRKILDTWEQTVRETGLLKDFEKWLTKRVGERPRSMPMATWLRYSLPSGCDEFVLLYERAAFGANDSGVILEDSIRIVKQLWKDHEKTPGTKDVRGVD
ncbi:MAG: transglutaminase-like domain-containing protein [Akkermansiaceae bacterium]|nr:transglutaminase-like domain-containing protein [Akkermansiaceae bacterium]